MTELSKNGFTFKRFFIAHDRSPMKVTTDSCILGAWSPITENTRTVLDIGTGCGIIALMLAQRLEHQDSHIDAIDIDFDAIAQTQDNIAHAPFKNVYTKCIDINQYRLDSEPYYDLIVSNPPYFQSAVECRDPQRQRARYTESLDHQQLIVHVKRLLKPAGRFCVVLPYHLSEKFIALCQSAQLFLTRQLNINYSQDKPYSLVVLCFQQILDSPLISQTLCIRDDQQRYSEEFRQLLQGFYLFRR